jgi:hypothetical protein
MLKIIIVIIGYTLNAIVDDEKIYNLKIEKRIHFLKTNNYSFCQCGN